MDKEYGKDFILTNKGIMKKEEDKEGQITWKYISRYIKIINVEQSSESKDISITIKYLYKGKYHEITINREQLHHNDFMKLVGKGVDVYKKNVDNVLSFLRIQEEKDAPYNTVHNNLGWVLNDAGLVYKHDRLINSSGNNSNSNYKGSFNITPKGSLKDYLILMRNEVIGNVHLELALTLGFTAPVIGLLSTIMKIESLIFSIYGEAGTGKTTAVQLAISPFGEPTANGLLKNWGATKNALISLLRNNFGVPLALDEASMTEIKDLTSIIYMIAENKDKTRLDKNSDLKEQQQWATTAITTAEHSLFQKTNQNTGLRMRMFEIGEVKWTSSAENSNRLKDGLFKNYGHAGIEFVQYLMKLGTEEVIERCNKWKREFEMILPETELRDRVAAKYGLILATAEMVKESLGLDLHLEGITEILKHNEQQASLERDKATNVYNYIIGKIAQYKKNFMIDDKEITGHECWGKINFKDDKLEVTMFKHKLNDLLKEFNITEPNIVLNKWKEKGYLKAENGKNTNRRKVITDEELRVKSGLQARPTGSKGVDVVYVILVDKEKLEGFGVKENISDERINSTFKARKFITAIPHDDLDELDI